MNIQDEKAADLACIVAEIGEPVVWNGRTYRAIITAIESLETLQIGGFGEEYDFTVKIAKASLGNNRPKVNEAVQFDRKTYRIARVSESPSYPMVTLRIDHYNCCATYATFTMSGPGGSLDSQPFWGDADFAFNVADLCGGGGPP